MACTTVALIQYNRDGWTGVKHWVTYLYCCPLLNHYVGNVKLGYITWERLPSDPPPHTHTHTHFLLLPRPSWAAPSFCGCKAQLTDHLCLATAESMTKDYGTNRREVNRTDYTCACGSHQVCLYFIANLGCHLLVAEVPFSSVLIRINTGEFDCQPLLLFASG